MDNEVPSSHRGRAGLKPDAAAERPAKGQAHTSVPERLPQRRLRARTVAHEGALQIAAAELYAEFRLTPETPRAGRAIETLLESQGVWVAPPLATAKPDDQLTLQLSAPRPPAPTPRPTSSVSAQSTSGRLPVKETGWGGIALVVVLLILWTQGVFDHALVKIGLNFDDCFQNGFGAVFCGDEVKEYKRSLRPY